MTDVTFDVSAATMKAKYERLENKTSAIESGTPSAEKYVTEKGVVDYVDGLKDVIKEIGTTTKLFEDIQSAGELAQTNLANKGVTAVYGKHSEGKCSLYDLAAKINDISQSGGDLGDLPDLIGGI